MWKALICSVCFVSAATAQEALPGLRHRAGRFVTKLAVTNGANKESEAAVARGLAWLARQQEDDGTWKSDGKSDDRVTATSLALLPFLGAAQLPKGSDKYSQQVSKALEWLIKRQAKDGSFEGTDGRGHALATLALCETVGMTSDPVFKTHAEAAVAWLVKGQAKNGSWGTKLGEAGDVPTTYWAIQALTAAKIAQVQFDTETVYNHASKYLEGLLVEGTKIDNVKASDLPTATAQGTHSLYLMGKINPAHTAYAWGLDYLKATPPKLERFDLDYYHAATPAFFVADGPDWHKFWNPKIRDLLTEAQQKRGGDKVMGSWEKSSSPIGEQYGVLGTTCLSLLTLEVYYRYLPLF